MTAQSFIAVEVLQGLLEFRYRLFRCWGFPARSTTSFNAINFLHDLTEIGMAKQSRIVATQGHAERTASSYSSIDRAIAMNRNYKNRMI